MNHTRYVIFSNQKGQSNYYIQLLMVKVVHQGQDLCCHFIKHLDAVESLGSNPNRVFFSVKITVAVSVLSLNHFLCF